MPGERGCRGGLHQEGGDCRPEMLPSTLRNSEARTLICCWCSTCPSQVLDILYQTEDGFAVPEEEEGGVPPPEEGEEEY